MVGLFDYLHWRGDLAFSQVPLNEIDALIFSALAYVRFGGTVETQPDTPVALQDALDDFLQYPDLGQRMRTREDLELFRAMADAPRFRSAALCHYRDILIPEEDTQFAAITFLLDDGSAFLAFRGTDYSLAGWKEDLNMSFQFTVPAQRLALAYTQEVAGLHPLPLWLGGHSKGGNLAMFAGIHSPEAIRRQILGVFNHDGPGFREHILQNPAYQEMLPRLHTYVPQSSVVGLLLEHQEPFTIVKSKTLGILQHELYTWELDGPKFVLAEEFTADAKFLNQTIDHWLADMTLSDRNDAVEAIFELLSAGDVDNVMDIIKPTSLVNYLITVGRSQKIRRVLGGEFLALLEAARKTLSKKSEEETQP